MFNREECNKKYKKTLKGKMAIVKAQAKYNRTEKGKYRSKQYSQSEKGKAKRKESRPLDIGRKITKAKRRQLGFMPLNEYYYGSEAHHISENFVIHIPKLIHKSIGHNIWTWKNMKEINRLAIEYIR